MEDGSDSEVSDLKQETLIHRQEVEIWAFEHSEEAFTDLLSVWEMEALCHPWLKWINLASWGNQSFDLRVGELQRP